MSQPGRLCNENPHVPLHPGFAQIFPFNFDGFLCPFGECFIARFLRVFCPWWLGCLELKNNSKVQSWAIKQPFKLCACLHANGVLMCCPHPPSCEANVHRDDWTPNVEQIQAGSCLWCLDGPHPKGRLMGSAEPSLSESRY